MLKNIKIAHRGLHDDKIPENSLAAFKKCVDNKTAIELDVQLLKDDNIVVFHDPNILRMTGIDKNIKELVVDDLNKIYLKETKEKIPLLKDVLKLVDCKVLLDIELKCDENSHKLENLLINTLNTYNGKVLLKSFNYKAVKYLKKKTDYKVGLLYSNVAKNTSKLKKFFKENLNFNIFIKPDFIGCNKKSINDKCILNFKGPILVWTIKTQKEYDKFNSMNYGLIFENNLKEINKKKEK